jgi:hypothetical protein
VANKTTNYELTKPLAEEFYNVEDQNGNMDIIDAELKKNADSIAKVKSVSAVVTTTGTGAAYLASVDGITELSAGLTLTIIPHTASTSTAPTLNLNSLGAKAIKQKLSGSTGGVTAGNSVGWITADKPLTVRYDGTQWVSDLTRQDAAGLSGAVPISGGGTGSTTASGARSQLGAEGKHTTKTATLSASGWSNNTQSANVSGVTTSNTILVAPTADSQEVWGKAGIVCTAQSAGKLTFTCKSVPSAAVTANIVILGG